MSQATVGRWGKDLAVRLPPEVVESVGLHEGESVNVGVLGDRIVIRRAAPRSTLEELFRGKRPDDWRAAYAGPLTGERMSAARS